MTFEFFIKDSRGPGGRGEREREGKRKKNLDRITLTVRERKREERENNCDMPIVASKKSDRYELLAVGTSR